MWALFQVIRRQVKLGLSVLVWDLLFLFLIMIITSAITKQVMHPAISIIGALWVLATAAAIWHLGGVQVDSLFFARLLDTEVGKEFARALNIFFVLGSTTVIFFFLFPVWKFWAGTIILPVILIGVFACANMAERKTNWNLFFWIYASTAGIILAAIVIAGLTGWTTENGAAFIQKTWFKSWIERLLLLGFLFLALSFVPKMPKGILRFGAGLAIIAGTVLLVFPEIQPSNLGLDQPMKATKAPVAVVPQSLVPTGITLQPGETILGTKNPDAPPVVLIVRFPNGEGVEINPKHWTSRSIELTHVGHNVKGRPGEIFYLGEKGRYRFEKISSQARITPAVYRPPATSPKIDRQTFLAPSPAPKGKETKEKENCPFE